MKIVVVGGVAAGMSLRRGPGGGPPRRSDRWRRIGWGGDVLRWGEGIQRCVLHL